MDLDRTLAASPFPDDAGLADPATRRALAAAVAGATPTDYLRAVATLCLDRVLVPVVATATRMGTASASGGDAAGSGSQGRLSDKEAEMAVVLLQTADGRRAMLAFTGMDSLRAWDADARPVPVTLDLAAQAATADAAAALLVDVAGPHPLVIDDEVLTELAQGHRLMELAGGQFGWAVPS